MYAYSNGSTTTLLPLQAYEYLIGGFLFRVDLRNTGAGCVSVCVDISSADWLEKVKLSKFQLLLPS